MATLPIFSGFRTIEWLDNQPNSGNATDAMPVLFVGHGSPMNAILENQFVEGFRNIAKSIAKPKLIVCISAHWYVRGTMITAMEKPRTIHDFGGFPPELYKIQYPANGSPEWAKKIKEMNDNESISLDNTWGLDHGAWTVLKHIFPSANIPVVQISIDYSKDSQWHFDFARKLSQLREKGVLFVGSGNIVHNLGLVDFKNFDKDNYGFDWAFEAREKINNLLMNNDLKSLINYDTLGKPVQLAIPTPEHYLPLIYALGLKNNNEPATFFNDKMVAGSLSMTSVKFG